MLMYMFNPDHVGHAVRDALVAAAARGVEVRLLIDGFGSDAPADFFEALNRAGGEECVFNPSYGRRYLLRNHQKLIVIDDEVAIIGGANIDDSYMTDRGSKHWRDLWLRLEGPEVAVPSQYFDTLFRWAIEAAPEAAICPAPAGRIQRVARAAAVEVQRPLEHAQQLVAKHRPGHPRAVRGSTWCSLISRRRAR